MDTAGRRVCDLGDGAVLSGRRYGNNERCRGYANESQEWVSKVSYLDIFFGEEAYGQFT